MNALLTAIVLWLSANFGLPATHELPQVEYAPPSRSKLCDMAGLPRCHSRPEIARLSRTGAKSWRSTWMRKKPFTCLTAGRPITPPTCRFWCMRWFTIFRMSPSRNFSARRSVRNSPMKRSSAGSDCSGTICRAISRSIGSRCCSAPDARIDLWRRGLVLLTVRRGERLQGDMLKNDDTAAFEADPFTPLPVAQLLVRALP